LIYKLIRREAAFEQLTHIYSSENGRAVMPEPRERVISPGCRTYPKRTLPDHLLKSLAIFI
jgi:hypothetical protein